MGIDDLPGFVVFRHVLISDGINRLWWLTHVENEVTSDDSLEKEDTSRNSKNMLDLKDFLFYRLVG